MDLEYWVAAFADQLTEVKARLDSLEANQRNAESGTSDCSGRQDAVLSHEKRAFRPAGNPDAWDKLLTRLELMLGVLHRGRGSLDSDESVFLADRIIIDYKELIELAKRRGC